MKDSDFVTVRDFSSNGTIFWNAQSLGDLGGIFKSTFNGVLVLKRASGQHSIFPKEFARDLETNVKLICCKWYATGRKMSGYQSENPTEANSQRFFSIPDHCFDVYETNQYADYATSDEERLILQKSLAHLKSACAPCFENLEHHAFNICSSFGKALDKSCYFVQYDFQHDIYAGGIGNAGKLEPQLFDHDGNGFGKEIFKYQI